MKIRNGFVSNSSSSSFVVAIKKPTEKTIDSVKFIEFVAKHTEKNPVWKNVFGIAEKRKIIQAEIIELEKDLAFCAKELDFWSKVKDNKTFDKWLSMINRYLEKNENTRASRQMREYENNYPESTNIPPCKMLTIRLRASLSRIRENIANLKKELSQIRSLKDSEWGIYSFVEDVNFSNKVVSSVVEDLVKSRQAIILNKYTS